MQPLFPAAFLTKTHDLTDFTPHNINQLLHLYDLHRLKSVFNHTYIIIFFFIIACSPLKGPIAVYLMSFSIPKLQFSHNSI